MSPAESAGLREIYAEEQRKCPAGYVLRQREWGVIGIDCLDQCATCTVKKRQKKVLPTIKRKRSWHNEP